MKQSKREPWLLLFNCQVLGLSNCLNLLNDTIEVQHYDPGAFRKDEEAILGRIDSYDRILVASQLAHLLPDRVTSRENVWLLPTFAFDAYHPDICYLRQDGKTLKGPMGDYHSLIAFAAFKKGVPLKDAAGLFQATLYERMGYFDRWDPARDRLLQGFAEAGFDLRAYFSSWSRSGSFMYSNNHVRIHCLADLARSILERAGKQVVYEEARPHDNLANGPIFPIYPEVGSRLGVKGSYHFKLGGQYRFIRLEEFLDASYLAYAAAPDASIFPEQTVAFNRAMAAIGA